jgi:hypothetical protein
MNCLQTQGMNIGFIHTGYIVDFVWIMDELIKLSDNLMCGYCKKFFKIKYTPSKKLWIGSFYSLASSSVSEYS